MSGKAILRAGRKARRFGAFHSSESLMFSTGRSPEGDAELCGPRRRTEHALNMSAAQLPLLCQQIATSDRCSGDRVDKRLKLLGAVPVQLLASNLQFDSFRRRKSRALCQSQRSLTGTTHRSSVLSGQQNYECGKVKLRWAPLRGALSVGPYSKRQNRYSVLLDGRNGGLQVVYCIAAALRRRRKSKQP